MGLFSSLNKHDKEGNLKCRYALAGGITSFAYTYAVVDVFQRDDRKTLEIVNASSKKDTPVFLNYAQIYEVGQFENLKVGNDGGSAAGEALIGGALFGTVGALVGGMSGMSKTKNIRRCLVLNYHPDSAPSESKTILLEIVQASIFHDDFIRALLEKTNARDITPQSGQL